MGSHGCIWCECASLVGSSCDVHDAEAGRTSFYATQMIFNVSTGTNDSKYSHAFVYEYLLMSCE